MWRPEGWKNRHSDFIRDNPHRVDEPFNSNKGCVSLGFVKSLQEWDFEAGADAMLNAIKDLLQKEANEYAGSPYGSACSMFLEEKLEG